MNNHVMPPDTWTAAFAGGLLMGVIHVVTGADHLSAVATLSCGNDRYAATVLGVRWGVGHCVGLLVVFLAVLAATEEIDRASVRGVEVEDDDRHTSGPGPQIRRNKTKRDNRHHNYVCDRARHDPPRRRTSG